MSARGLVAIKRSPLVSAPEIELPRLVASVRVYRIEMSQMAADTPGEAAKRGKSMKTSPV